MQRSKAFVKQTRKGKVLKVVREHYLRDDIFCGASCCTLCAQEEGTESLQVPTHPLLVLDTNVVLHQIDLLEHAKEIANVVILQTVLDEVKNRNLGVYNRLRQLISDPTRHFFVFSNEHHRDTYIEREEHESPNDRNDRAIRVASLWYLRHLSGNDVAVTLLTNDMGNKLKAIQEGLPAQAIHAFVRTLDNPQLLDYLSVVGDTQTDETENQDGGKGRKGKKKMFSDHLPLSDISTGIKAGRLHQGCLRINMHNCFEGYVSSHSLDDDVVVQGLVNLNRAVDGDIVAIEVLPEDQWSAPAVFIDNSATGETPEDEEDGEAMEVDKMSVVSSTASTAVPGTRKPSARVVGIVKRNWRPYCGSLEPLNTRKSGQSRSSNRFFLPVDQRIPKIRIQTRQSELLEGKRIIVCIDTWEADSRHPQGHYTRIIGDVGHRDTESEVILLEHDVPIRPFSASVLACLPAADYTIPEDEIAKRLDLRGLNICSIDPPGCKDIDDALHCIAMPNGNFQVGVHIADVTHFMKPNTPLDEEAADRCTTVYLVEKRTDMLPALLTENLCSLRSNVERLSFSCLWELTPDGEVVNADYRKTVIRSVAALTYAEAQNRVDDPRDTTPLTASIRQLNNLAKNLRAKRIANGALTLASPEVRFSLDTETHNPVDVGMYQLKDTNSLVEEFMLLANIYVAKKIVHHYPLYSVLRRHPAPTPSRLEEIANLAKNVGIEINTSSSKALADSLDRAVKPEDPYFNKLIRIMATRCMNQAVYFCSGDMDDPEYSHYGLATDLYTHFTSPIRRYADDLVHRLLAAALDIEPLPDLLSNKDQVSKLCDRMNHRHRNAQFASRASTELHTFIYFKNKRVTEDAVVLRVRKNGYVALIPRYGIEGIVFLSKPDEPSKYVFDEAMQSLRNGVETIQVFNHVWIEISVETENYRNKLILTHKGRHEPNESVSSAPKRGREGEEQDIVEFLEKQAGTADIVFAPASADGHAQQDVSAAAVSASKAAAATPSAGTSETGARRPAAKKSKLK